MLLYSKVHRWKTNSHLSVYIYSKYNSPTWIFQASIWITFQKCTSNIRSIMLKADRKCNLSSYEHYFTTISLARVLLLGKKKFPQHFVPLCYTLCNNKVCSFSAFIAKVHDQCKCVYFRARKSYIRLCSDTSPKLSTRDKRTWKCRGGASMYFTITSFPTNRK